MSKVQNSGTATSAESAVYSGLLVDGNDILPQPAANSGQQSMQREEPAPQRRTNRLRGYDYTADGAYFITVCTQHRVEVFGCVKNGAMHLSEAGKIVVEEWLRSQEVRAEVTLGEWVVMPNHFHAIVRLDPSRSLGRATGGSPLPTDNAPSVVGATGGSPSPSHANPPAPPPVHLGRPTGPPSRSIGALKAGFKSITTKRINTLRNSPGAALWQRNYYDHIIRDERDYARIAQYIVENPVRWSEDTLNPAIAKTANSKSKERLP